MGYYLYSKRQASVRMNFDRLIGHIGAALQSKYPQIYKLLKPYFPN